MVSNNDVSLFPKTAEWIFIISRGWKSFFGDNFFQSDRKPIKVYIFEKPLTRAFQKCILLGVYDHSEKSYHRKKMFHFLDKIKSEIQFCPKSGNIFSTTTFFRVIVDP